jgi:DNA-binding NarL/FixJ family response regulator
MISAIVICDDQSIAVVNSEMSAEHHRQLTELRKLARSVATKAPLMRAHYDIMYHVADGCDPQQIAAKVGLPLDIVRKHIDMIVSRLTETKRKIVAGHDINIRHASNGVRNIAAR